MEFLEHFKAIKEGAFAPYYVYTGPEVYLLDNTLKYVEDNYLLETYKDMNLTVIENNVDVDHLISVINTLPFFDERRLVILHQSNLLKQVKEADETKLLNLLKDFPESVHVIFVEKDMDKRKKLYKAFNKAGAIVEFKKLSHGELVKWVKKKFKEYGKVIDNHALTYFIEMVNYLSDESNINLYDVENQIKALVTIEGDIKTSHIDQYLEVPIEKNIFKMMDAVSNQNASEALLIFNSLVDSGEAEIKIFSLLNSQFRNIYKCKLLMDAGHTANSIAPKLGIHPFVAKKSTHFASRFSAAKLQKIVGLLEDTDTAMKSSGTAPKLLIEKIIFEIQLV